MKFFVITIALDDLACRGLACFAYAEIVFMDQKSFGRDEFHWEIDLTCFTFNADILNLV